MQIRPANGRAARPTGRPQVPWSVAEGTAPRTNPRRRVRKPKRQEAIISRVLSPRGCIPCGTGLRWQPFICSPDCSGALAANPGRSGRNTPTHLAMGARPLFGLAPGGVCHAVAVASPPVRSYRTLSPLPVRPFRGSHRRFALCGTFPCAPRGAPAGVTRHPCFVEPGLSSRLATRGCLRPPDKAAYRPADEGRKPPACYRVRP